MVVDPSKANYCRRIDGSFYSNSKTLQDMAQVKHKLLMAKSCCTFQGFKKINVPIIHKCVNMSCDLVCCAEKYTKIKILLYQALLPQSPAQVSSLQAQSCQAGKLVQTQTEDALPGHRLRNGDALSGHRD